MNVVLVTGTPSATKAPPCYPSRGFSFSAGESENLVGCERFKGTALFNDC